MPLLELGHLRPELLRAFSRIAQLQAEVDSLRHADAPPSLELLAPAATADGQGLPSSSWHVPASSGKSPGQHKSPLQPVHQPAQQQHMYIYIYYAYT